MASSRDVESGIWAEGLTRRFGDQEAVSQLDLELPAGEVFGFLGPNGAGKSTTTRMLTTLLRPTTGEARVAGYDPASEPLAVRKRIGYVPDELPVYKQYTATEFLVVFARLHGYGRRGARERARELLEQVGLVDVGRKTTGAFSKGMKQRLGLARALINEPQVLFLDEPASGLDPIGRREMRSLFKQIGAGGATIFLCSHDLNEVMDVCQRAAILHQGRLVREVPLDERARRTVHIEYEGETTGLRDAILALPGLARARHRDHAMVLEFAGPFDRRDAARAVQRSGGVLLDIREERADLEEIYRQALGQGGTR